MIITIMIFFILTTIVGVMGILNLLTKIDVYENFILDRQEAYEALLQRIRDIDSRELFEKDDEVGVTFDDIKNEIEEFKNIIE
jgi:inner membrane protein involved in colicin E2 resistance